MSDASCDPGVVTDPSPTPTTRRTSVHSPHAHHDTLFVEPLKAEVGASASASNSSTIDTTTTTAKDRVRWPINRLSYEELKPLELAAVEKLFAARDDAPVLMKWVLLHRAGKFHKRLIIVSPLRLWLLQRKKPFKTQLACGKELQLMRIQRVNVLRGSAAAAGTTTTTTTSSTTTSIELAVFESSCAQQPTVLHFDPGVHSESFVRLFQRLLHALRLVFPDKQLPKVALPPQCHWQEFFPTSADSRRPEDRAALLDAMVTAYRAFCDDLRVPARASVTARLAECAGSSVDFQYCLAFPPGVDGYQQQPFSLRRHLAGLLVASSLPPLPSSTSSSAAPASAAAIQLREVQALARTLEHCHCFDGVLVYDLAMNDIGTSALFQALLSPFSRIQALALTNVRLGVRALRILQHVVLQSTIKRVQQQPLQLRRLDFSFNAFSQAMAQELATVFELLPSGLETLQLEQCALSAVASRRTLLAIKSNAAFAASLRELNLAGNCLGVEGTRVLASWLATAFALHRLDVSQTDLRLNVFVQALRQNSLLHESSLRVLDVSYNRMRTAASEDLGWILGKTQSLSTLFLRGMHCAFSATTPLRGTIFSSLLTGGGGGGGGGLKKTHLKSILAPMLRNTGRALPCLVDLSENDLSGAKASLLAQLLDESPIAGRASLRLDHTQLHDRASILLLHALRGCRTLQSLSLEGNGCVKRRTASSLQRFHASSASSSSYSATTALAPPSALELAAANVFALMLGGSASASIGAASDTQVLAAADASGSSKPLPLKELCLKSEASMLFGAHVITAAVDALALNETLQVLDVSGNECGDVLATRLGAVLRVNCSLQVLFWDDNFTTVDGFMHFYDGLALNRTLVMVQMPIRDTRRILEEQKDPPREKLFSVLGKIFKVTERNQTLVRARTPHMRRQCTSSAPHTKESVARQAARISCDEASCESGNQAELQRESERSGDSPEDDGSFTATRSLKDDNVGSCESIERATDPTISSSAPLPVREDPGNDDNDGANGDDAHNLWGLALADSVGSRYPSTMNSWSRSSRDDVLRASWTQFASSLT